MARCILVNCYRLAFNISTSCFHIVTYDAAHRQLLGISFRFSVLFHLSIFQPRNLILYNQNVPFRTGLLARRHPQGRTGDRPENRGHWPRLDFLFQFPLPPSGRIVQLYRCRPEMSRRRDRIAINQIEGDPDGFCLAGN